MIRPTRHTLKQAAVGAACTLLLGLCSCGPSAESILKKYESSGTVEPRANKSGVSVAGLARWPEDGKGFSLTITYSHPLLNHVEAYARALENRWSVVNAGNPSEAWPVHTALRADSLDTDEYGLPAYRTVLSVDGKEVKSKFVLLGFRGIGKEESEALETPSLFYIVDLSGEADPRLLAENPFAGDAIFPVGGDPVYFSADALRLQQIRGAWGRTGGSFKTDPNGVMTLSPALTFTVDSAYQDKPAMTLGPDGVFTSDIDYSGNEFIRFFSYAKSLRIGQNTTWACENFAEASGENTGCLFSCDLKLAPAGEGIDYRLTLVEKDVLRLDVFERVYLPEAPDPHTGLVFKGGTVPVHTTLNFKRL